VNKYNGQEFDAIKTFYFRYNFRANPKYDPKAGTDKHVKFLIDKYSSGERILLKDGNLTEVNVDNITFEKKVEEANSQIQNITEKTKGSIDEYFKRKSDDLENYFKNKDIELKNRGDEIKNLVTDNFKTISKKLDELNLPISEKELRVQAIKESEEKIELRLNIDFENSDLELPKEINSMPPGTRFLILDSNNKMCALEIKDVFYDYISYPDKCIKEITIEKV